MLVYNRRACGDVRTLNLLPGGVIYIFWASGGMPRSCDKRSPKSAKRDEGFSIFFRRACGCVSFEFCCWVVLFIEIGFSDICCSFVRSFDVE